MAGRQRCISNHFQFFAKTAEEEREGREREKVTFFPPECRGFQLQRCSPQYRHCKDERVRILRLGSLGERSERVDQPVDLLFYREDHAE
jgi:hypothetical protein